MNFRFDSLKATQVAAAFIEKEGGRINVMKLVKLVYLLDRLSLGRRCVSVVGGDYFSMKNGPVISELLDLINTGTLFGVQSDWESHISDRENHEVQLMKSPGTDRLSESEMLLLREVYAEHGDKNQFQLAEWCHDNCPEWHRITAGCREISVETILEVLGRSSREIDRVVKDEREISFLGSILG